MNRRELSVAANRLARLLHRLDLKLVLAESCTGGLVSATLAGIPGISNHLCGSAVVYRMGTKASWLGISEAVLDDPGPVSSVVAERMAQSVLRMTPEADLAASVTGHLGPDAPARQDGLIYIGFAARCAGVIHRRKTCLVARHWLQRGTASSEVRAGKRLRLRRQLQAAHLVIAGLYDLLNENVRS